MKRKDLTEGELNKIASLVDNEGFWYALSSGGWFKPEDILADENNIKKVNDAIATIDEFERLVPEL